MKIMIGLTSLETNANQSMKQLQEDGTLTVPQAKINKYHLIDLKFTKTCRLRGQDQEDHQTHIGVTFQLDLGLEDLDLGIEE